MRQRTAGETLSKDAPIAAVEFYKITAEHEGI